LKTWKEITMKPTLILCAASSALLTAAIASAQTSSIPDPSSPAPTTEDRATPAETRDTMPTRTKAPKGAFNAMESAGGTLNDKDATFVKKVASIGAEEVEAGKLAAEHASDAQVKEFASTMVDDHSKANDELKSIVENKGISLPDAPQGAQKTELDSLKSKSGAAFDQAYANANVKGHQEAVRLFTTASKSAKDPEVKAFAEKTLPTLKHHLEMAQTMQKAVAGVSGKMNKSKKAKVEPTDTSGGG
jgi:putative membrane protein